MELAKLTLIEGHAVTKMASSGGQSGGVAVTISFGSQPTPEFKGKTINNEPLDAGKGE